MLISRTSCCRFAVANQRCAQYVDEVAQVTIESDAASFRLDSVVIIDPYSNDYVQLRGAVDVGPEHSNNTVTLTPGDRTAPSKHHCTSPTN